MKIANDYLTLSVSHSAVTNAVAYDAFNVMTNMATFRDETVGRADPSAPQGDTTTWSYDEATGLLLAKTYADGYGPTYTYTDSGNLATRTWARGVVTTYAYDGWNQLVSTVYSDGTPSISLAYDAMGRQVSATDAVGTTTTTYSDYGEVASESVSGLYSRTLSHVRDVYGRDLGYNLNNSRKNIIEYETDTARTKRVMFANAWYTYGYLPGTDLKSSLTVGTAGRTDWTYEPSRDLLTQVKNTAFGSVVSQYDYVNDALGRRTEIARSGTRMTESRSDAYGYNDRNELTNAVKNATLSEYAYQYDDIGNRLSSLDLGTNRTYAVNALNQYTLVGRVVPNVPQEEFAPQFDLDGNQTLIQTSTGIWSVTYNGENRPVLWTCGATNIVMSFDRMGRRVEYIETVSDNAGGPGSVPAATNAHHRFVYDGYLCIQRLNAAANNSIDLAFGWDPTEPIATRPLWMQRPAGSYNFFYFHDGNKNVSDIVSYQSARGVPAHYEYAPFGAVIAATTNTAFTAFNVAEVNPFRFSSEYSDAALGLTYYIFRYYDMVSGRWMTRDPLSGVLLMSFVGNSPVLRQDFVGLMEELSFEEYFKQFIEKNFNDSLSEDELFYIKSSLWHGCIGVAWINLGHPPHASQNSCYTTREAAELRKKSLNAICCKDGGDAVVYSVHFDNKVGRDKVNPKAKFNPDGSVDMSNLDNSSGKFDYGFVQDDGTIIGATAYYNPDSEKIFKDPPKEDSKVVVKTVEEWQKGADSSGGYDSEVWCAECRNLNYLRDKQ